MNQTAIIELLRAEVLPTFGCTEPGAVALAAAYAGEALDAKEAIHKIEVLVNANVYKNGVAVGIPGTGETGLPIAAALGVIKRQPKKQLAVLEDISQMELQAARKMLAAGIVQVSVDEKKSQLWIKVRVESGCDWCEAVIEGHHTNISSIRKNGQFLLDRSKTVETKQNYRSVLSESGSSISQIIRMVESIPSEQLEFVLDGVKMNSAAAQAGIDKKLGMGIGATYQELVAKGLMSEDVIQYAKTLTAAAADARMSGEPVAVMSSAGSGNHGITVILPVYAVAQKTGVSRERLIRAVALSHLITIYIKMHTGNLSALCGCAVAAATGASAAVTWMMQGDMTAIQAAMKNVIANLTGMICDGGKVGCALKLSTAAAVAVESSLLALRRIVVPDTNGIIEDSIESTIKNLGKISNPGMVYTDKVIMDVMLNKEGHAQDVLGA